MTKPAGRCPLCGGQTVRVRAEDGGAIEEPLLTLFGGERRLVRMASFYACSACEWCQEQAPKEWVA
jgi:hypothetical protein